MSWQNEVDELGAVRNLARRMGGEDGIARQKQQGRLTVRERVDLLVDPGSFEEIMSTLVPRGRLAQLRR